MTQATVSNSAVADLLRRRYRDLDDLRKTIYPRPDHDIVLLITVEDMSEVDSPDNVAVCTDPRHQVPPAMTLKQEAVRHPNASSPRPKCRAILDIQRPDPKPAEENRQPTCHQEPHGVQDLHVSFVLVFIFLFALQWVVKEFSLLAVFLLAFPQGRSQCEFHTVDALEDNEDRHCGVNVLVKCWVLHVVVIYRDRRAEQG